MYILFHYIHTHKHIWVYAFDILNFRIMTSQLWTSRTRQQLCLLTQKIPNVHQTFDRVDNPNYLIRIVSPPELNTIYLFGIFWYAIQYLSGRLRFGFTQKSYLHTTDGCVLSEYKASHRLSSQIRLGRQWKRREPFDLHSMAAGNLLKNIDIPSNQ